MYGPQLPVCRCPSAHNVYHDNYGDDNPHDDHPHDHHHNDDDHNDDDHDYYDNYDHNYPLRQRLPKSLGMC
jgi:hypothetical protein